MSYKTLNLVEKWVKKIGDSEQQRVIDRIMCVAFRQARDAGADFMNRKWIVEKLGRSLDWVTRNWNRNPQECFTDFGKGRPQQLSQESRNMVAQCSNKQRESNREVAQQIFRLRSKFNVLY